MTHTFLVEIGTEELPPTSLKELSNAFTVSIENGLKARKIAFSESRPFATPRRLAVIIEGLAGTTPIEESKVWGPPAKIAFDADGNPTKAAQAFAKKNNITVDELASESDGKQEKLVCTRKTGGQDSKVLLADIVRNALAALPIKKRMRWGSSRTEFVRPVKWLVLMLDQDVLEESILGVKASNRTHGHRFHANKHFDIEEINQYDMLLYNKGKIIVDFDKRKAEIRGQVEKAAAKINGTAVISDDLLDEVTGLVEWPVALAGRFDDDFLNVPAQALISSMKEHQKYFHVVDDKNQLMPYFITVSNIESKSPEQVIDGNERVIRPRLSDAAFFYNTDKKTSLESRRDKLKTVLFQAKLGSVYEKTERIKKLASFISKTLNADTSAAERAAQLCKSDLVSSMVYEFPDMQGIAGHHYALNDGESEVVATAIEEQYMPKFAGDDVPASDVGAIIALADRIDTITGIFGIGLKPTGSKDPFALRRASLGALRILVEKSYDLDLQVLVKVAAENFEALPAKDSVVNDVLAYCLERFKAWYEEENIAPEVFQAVNAKRLSAPFDINRRVHAVAAFTQLPQAQSLAAANKRVSNILNKHLNKQNESIPAAVDTSLLREEAEKALNQALANSHEKAAPLVKDNQYTDALSALAALKEPVDDFFDNVMVMTEDTAVRDNRLALLNQLRAIFLEVADISHLVVKA